MAVERTVGESMSSLEDAQGRFGGMNDEGRNRIGKETAGPEWSAAKLDQPLSRADFN